MSLVYFPEFLLTRGVFVIIKRLAECRLYLRQFHAKKFNVSCLSSIVDDLFISPPAIVVKVDMSLIGFSGQRVGGIALRQCHLLLLVAMDLDFTRSNMAGEIIIMPKSIKKYHFEMEFTPSLQRKDNNDAVYE